MHREEEDRFAVRLVVPKFPDGSRNDEQGPSSSRKGQKRDDEQGENRRSEESMQQDRGQAEAEDDKVSTGGMSSLDFFFLSDFQNGTEKVGGTTEPAEEGTSTLEPPLEIDRNLQESSSPSNSKNVEKKTFNGVSEEKKNRRHCKSTFLGNVAR